MENITTNAVTNGRRVLHALAVVLEAQQISVITTSIIVEREGKRDRISLLEIVRAAQNSFDELERISSKYIEPEVLSDFSKTSNSAT